MEELLAAADVVSLHTLLDEKTTHMIDKTALELMKPDAVSCERTVPAAQCRRPSAQPAR